MNKHLSSMLLAGALWLLCLPAASAAVIYVNHAASGANNGTSWANAFSTLHPAIAAAATGDEIWVAQGTYFPTVIHFGGGSRNFTFYVDSKNIQIYGGFDGTETLLSQQDWLGNPTILSGELGAPGIADNALHVMWIDNVSNAMRVDGFTITGGNANVFSFPSNVGGGIFNDRFHGSVTSPTIANCTFSDNSANAGGALYNFGFLSGNASSPQVLDCVFTNNHTSTFGTGNLSEGGGAICNVAHNGGTSSPLISNCVFSGNTASNEGGAILNYSNNGTSAPNITGCTFSGNIAGAGGGIGSRAFSGGTCSPTIGNCSFTGNQSTGAGGAISNFAITGGMIQAEMSQLNFTGNTAVTNGGCIQNYGRNSGTCIANLRRCSFSASVCATAGGLYNTGFTGTCTVTLENCLFADCIANPNQGGAIYNNYATLACTNCTFAQNHATAQGGAVHTEGSPDATSFTNCIFWGNTGSFDPDISTAGVAVSLEHCLVSAANCGAINASAVCGAGMIFNQDPQFSNAAGGDFHLQACSPAIEAGTNAGAPPDDLDGNPQPHDGDGDGTATTDMGAFEYQGNRAPLAVCQDQTLTFSGSTASLAVSLLDGGSTGCSPLGFTVSGQTSLSFDCAGEAGEHLVTLTVTDAFGATATCPATVTAGPDADCDGFGDFCDLCPGGDDGVDNNFDGLPDCKFYPGFADLSEDWKCGNNNDKVVVCHNGQTKCFGQGAVTDHLAHGDFLGPCGGASCAMPLIGFGNGDVLELTASQLADHVQLYWVNNTGFKNDHFILEKSADGNQFESMGEQGNLTDDSEAKLYRADDLQPGEGENFYRIRLLLQDGSEVLSNVGQVSFPFDPTKIHLFPNPASRAAWLYLEKFAGKPGTLRVLDALGRQIDERHFEEIPGGAIELPLQGFRDGLYSVTLEVDGYRLQVKRLAVVR